MSALFRSLLYLLTETWVGPVLALIVFIPIAGFLLRIGWEQGDKKD